MADTARGDSDASKSNFPGSSGNVSTKIHTKCMQRAEKSCRSDPYVKFMIQAMEKLGCNFILEKHVTCEPCGDKVNGGFDPERKQVVMCENNISSQTVMNQVMTHELIHAFDVCRVRYEKDNLRHLACTEIRAANLSGDCFMSREMSRFKFGWKAHQQKCVKERAVKSILCVRDVSEEEANQIVESVFEPCFKDTEPFERIPP
ncbi:mitochondrial inner membrane protease ATP23 homolog [Rhopilema esculentum]|uniref:mitochondrial inner membrane protease ATP23 homolog n=1 Tax=Rhopilema esculentum TaxID=499914 RepID=UPI0031D2BEB6|eukprot:gene216-9852_t